MKKTLTVLSILLFLISNTAYSKTIPEIHKLSNDVTLSLGDASKDFCSATVINKEKNLAATANHCVEGARTIVYFVVPEDDYYKKVKYEYYKPLIVTNRKMKENGEVYSETKCVANVLGVDETKDVAVLKIEDRCVFSNEAKPSTKEVNYGDMVYTMGNPFMAYNAVSKAEVTQPKAYFDKIGKFPVILFSGQIAPGSSGGALVNKDGELIGITNWGVGTLAIASPVSNLIDLLKRLKQ